MSGEIDSLVQQLSAPGPGCCAAAERLAQLGEDAQPAAAELVAATTDEAAREWAVAALEGLGPPPADQLKRLVALGESSSPITAYWALTLVGRLDDAARSAAPRLAAVLEKSPHLEVRQQAAWALGRIGADDATTRQALATASRDADPRLARLAREALGASAAN